MCGGVRVCMCAYTCACVYFYYAHPEDTLVCILGSSQETNRHYNYNKWNSYSVATGPIT